MSRSRSVTLIFAKNFTQTYSEVPRIIIGNAMKWLIALLVLVLIGLQYRLWVGEGSIAHRIELQDKIEQQQAENELLKARNQQLSLEIDALRNGTEGIEERAREELGLIKENETFFMIIDNNKTSAKESKK